MQILAKLIVVGAVVLGIKALIGEVGDYKPDRPNKSVERTFTAPYAEIEYLGRARSLLKLPDGRELVISEQPAGHYIDVRVESNSFKRGTLLLKGDCSEQARLPNYFDTSHCN